jgi:hypothetical protein
MFIWVPNDIGGGCAALPNGFGPRLLPPAAGAAPPAASAAYRKYKQELEIFTKDNLNTMQNQVKRMHWVN